jgi:hypothetical protein
MLFIEASLLKQPAMAAAAGFSALEYRPAAAAVDGLARLRSALVRPPIWSLSIAS